MTFAGQLREVVTIQHAAEGITEGGDRVDEWADLLVTRARMKPKSASELVRAMRAVNETRYTATMRHKPEIGAGMRLIWNGRTFNIEGVLNFDERGQMVTLDCLEIAI